MKKIIAIPLLILYLFTITGSSIRAHFCGRHLMSWNFNNHGKDCGNCEKETKKKCCNNKIITAKVSHEQQHANPFVLHLSTHLAATDNITWKPEATAKLSSTLQDRLPKANAPPGLWQQIPLYKLHARFTYYG